ncbi:MAG: HIT family protein [Sedimenticola sp.]
MPSENDRTTSFELHPRLAADTFMVRELALCQLRLMNDSRFTWMILVPRRQGVTEVHQLETADQQQLMTESSLVAGVLMAISGAEKINIGALGNLVPQLHWHVVARHSSDPCWPGPVWGCGSVTPYREEELETLLERLEEHL